LSDALSANPRVTVLMTVFNGERHLGEAIDSVLRQSFADFELLIVDDASTDGTAALLDAISSSRVRVTRNEENLGLTRSLNRRLALARGTIIARHDADDVSEPERLARQIAFLDANPDVALAGAWYRKIDEAGASLGERTLPVDHDRLCWALHFYCPIVHSAAVFRTSVVREIGGYDEAFVYAQDYDLWSRLAASYRVANVGELLVRYRVGATTLTATIGEQSGEVLRIAARNIEALGIAAPSAAEHRAMGALVMGDVSGLAPADFVAAFDGVLTVLDRLRVAGSRALIDPRTLVDDVARAAAATLERHAARLSESDYRRAVDRLRLTSPVVAAALPRSRHLAALRGKFHRSSADRAAPRRS
jgi:hypothetical protein